MPIVPISRDVSIKVIRDVINLKSNILGQVVTENTQSGRYGDDLGTGKIRVKLRNFTTTTYTAILNVKKGSTTLSNQTITFTSSVERDFSFSDLAVGTYKVSIQDQNDSSNSHEVEFELGSEYVPNTLYNLYLKNKYPIEDISIAQDINSTSNWLRSRGVNIPQNLSPTNTENVGLKEWRGAQVFDGNAIVRSTQGDMYGVDQKSGYISIQLYPTGFSPGNIIVNLVNVKSITRNVHLASSSTFTFTDLKAGSYRLDITDTLTGSSQTMRYNIATTDTSKLNTYSFNGTDTLTGFVL